MSLPLIRAVLPKVPFLVTSTASHLLSLNPHSQHWDFRTFFTVAVLQAFLAGTENHDRKGRVMTVEQVQRMANQEQALDDEMWVSKIKMEFARGISAGKGEREGQGVTDEEVRLLEEMIDRAVRELGAGHGIGGEAKVEKAKVAKEVLTGEWTGWRNLEKRGTHKSVEKAGQEVWDEKRKWEALTEDVKGFREGMAEDGVVLWVHGGAYFVCDPHTHRPMGKFLSKEFGGPVLLPRYRLAPQNPFPAALVDTLLSYLYLLYPPSGSFHTAYNPSQIFLGGDSAGGGLSLSFTQLLLWFQTPNLDGSKKTIRWGGQERELGLPRGVLIMSGWVDLARCFPSEVQCAGGDYLPTPEQASKSKYRQSKAWPADPPRTHFYTDDSAITHPLVSPLMAKSWEGCPPMWLCVGDECLRDSNLYLAHRLLSSSVPLHFEKYTNMPHVFSMVIQQHPCSPYSFRSLGRFIKHHLSSSSSPRPYEYKLVKIHPKTLQEEQVARGELSFGGLTMEKLREMMEVEVGRWKRRIREEGVVEDDSDGEGEGKDVVPGGAKL